MSFVRKFFADGGSVLCHIVVVSLLGLSVFMASGCKKAVIRNQLKGLMSSTIVLPERITCVNNGEEYPMPDSVRSKAKLIVYIDSTECTSCRISHFGLYNKAFEISKEKGSFEVVLLLANVSLYEIPLIKYLSDMEYKTPIYVDVDNKFLELNPSLPEDRRMRALLLDDAGYPMCVGDPAASEKMLQVFIGAVNNLTSN